MSEFGFHPSTTELDRNDWSTLQAIRFSSLSGFNGNFGSRGMWRPTCQVTCHLFFLFSFSSSISLHTTTTTYLPTSACQRKEKEPYGGWAAMADGRRLRVCSDGRRAGSNRLRLAAVEARTAACIRRRAGERRRAGSDGGMQGER